MQAITHFLVGIILQILIFPENPPFQSPSLFYVIFGIVIIFFSHFLVDIFGRITYHTPDPHPESKFWVVWHIIIFISSGIILVFFWIPYWIGMGASVIVDIYDWGFIRGVRYFKKDPNWAKKYQIHPIIDKIRSKLFFWLPDWNEKWYGVIPEILIIGFSLFFIFSVFR
ncbi:MAG: hypothetical protein ACTSRG_01805 [Candidatus Helarchaeota archaeon]